MAIRNFSIDVNIDGRKTPLTGGPRTKDGGFVLNIHMRDENTSIPAIRIYGGCYDGKLTLLIEDTSDKNVKTVFIKETVR